MNPRLSWHLCKRDLTGPLKPWIFAWFGVCLLHLGMRLWQTLGGLSLEWLETRWRFDFILVVITAALIVPRLIHGESWVDGRTVWRARPPSPRSVMLARIISIGLVFVILSGTMEAVYFLVCGYGALTPRFLFLWLEVTSMWLLPLVALAVVTRSSRNFISLVLGLVIISILAILVLNWLGVPVAKVLYALPARPSLLAATIASVCLLAVAAQVRWRRPSISRGVVMGGILCVAGVPFMPLGMPPPNFLPVEVSARVFEAEVGKLAPLIQEDERFEFGLAAGVKVPRNSRRAWEDTYFIDGAITMPTWRIPLGRGYFPRFDQRAGWLTSESTPFPVMNRIAMSGDNRAYWVRGNGRSLISGQTGTSMRFTDYPEATDGPAAVTGQLGIACREPEVFAEFPIRVGLVWRSGAATIRVVSVNTEPLSGQHQAILKVGFRYEFPYGGDDVPWHHRSGSGAFSCALVDEGAGMVLVMGTGSKSYTDERGHYDSTRRVVIQDVIASQVIAPALASDIRWLDDPKLKLLLLRSDVVELATAEVSDPYVYLRRPVFENEFERAAAVARVHVDPISAESVRRYAVDLVNLIPDRSVEDSAGSKAMIIDRIRGIAGEHVEMLLNLAANCRIGGNDTWQGQMVLDAISPAIRPEHMTAILGQLTLPTNLDLVPVIRRMGWQSEAVPIMVELSTQAHFLPRQWAELMIETRDERGFERLVFHTARGDYGYDDAFFARLKALPGFPYERLVDLTEKCRAFLGEPSRSYIQNP